MVTEETHAYILLVLNYVNRHKKPHLVLGSLKLAYKFLSHPVRAHPVESGHVNSHRWPQPVGHCLFAPNHSLMCPRWPPWEQPWHQMNNPFTGKWLSKQNTMYRDLWSISHVKLILSNNYQVWEKSETGLLWSNMWSEHKCTSINFMVILWPIWNHEWLAQ